MHRPKQVRAGGCQDLSLHVTFSHHRCCVLKQAVTGCVLKRGQLTRGSGNSDTSFHTTCLSLPAAQGEWPSVPPRRFRFP